MHAADGDRHRRLPVRPLAGRPYRTTPLRGLFTRAKGGFYHDGRFKTLDQVVQHYEKTLELKLTDSQKRDLVQYLKSL